MKIDGRHVSSQEGVDLHRMALIKSRSTALKTIRGLISTWQWRSNDGNPMLARSWIMEIVDHGDRGSWKSLERWDDARL